MKTTEDLARQLQTSLPSSFCAELGEKGRVTRSMIGHVFTIFLSITRATRSYSEPDKFYGLQHIWYNVVMACLARFSRFRLPSLHCTRCAASHKIYQCKPVIITASRVTKNGQGLTDHGVYLGCLHLLQLWLHPITD